jgi:POT family proton-dependent oligopeptide transporter
MRAQPQHAPAIGPSPDAAGWAGHPRGLSTLFFTEMWERFSFYGMRAFLILYMTAPIAAGGLGFDDRHAGSVFGTYAGSVWLAAMGGGLVADRFLGAFRSVLWGGVVIALGHFTLAFESVAAFYAGLALIVIGTGLLKPNATTLVGSLYDANDARRDAGFSIFYMGINLGGFLGPLVAGGLAQRVNWHLGFSCAGVGMTLGLVQYVLGRDRLEPAMARIASARATPPVETGAGASIGEPAAVLGFTRLEWRRIAAVLLFFVFAAIFWAAYEEAASTLNLFAERYVDRRVLGFTIPTSWFVSLQSMYVIALAPTFAWLWVRLGPREPSTPVKFTLGLLFVGLSFVVLFPVGAMAQGAAGGRVSPSWLFVAYFLQVVGELCLSPVGNSAVTKLAPPRIGGLMVGVWFLAVATGDKLAGWIAGFSSSVPFAVLFGAIAAATLGATVILFLLVRPIQRLMGGVK